MTLNELIEVLEKLKDDGRGDYEMAVQYRDGGLDYCGVSYCGVDDDILLDVDETRK